MVGPILTQSVRCRQGQSCEQCLIMSSTGENHVSYFQDYKQFAALSMQLGELQKILKREDNQMLVGIAYEKLGEKKARTV